MTLWFWPVPAVDADLARLATEHQIRQEMDTPDVVRLAGHPPRWWPADPKPSVVSELARERRHLWR